MFKGTEMTLVGARGRKYLTAQERADFMDAARADHRPDVQTFALLLAYTGCRISEALAVRAADVDLAQSVVVIRTLKRRAEVWREVPLPEEFLRDLDLTHRLRRRQRFTGQRERRLWEYSRSTGFRHICDLMLEAGIEGPQATPKGLRHGFGIAAVEAGIPLTTIASFLGHADINTTAIYTNAIGQEARDLMMRMWSG